MNEEMPPPFDPSAFAPPNQLMEQAPLPEGGMEFLFANPETYQPPAPPPPPFDVNLAEILDEDELSELAQITYDDYKSDKAGREDWEESFEQAVDMLGIKYEEIDEPFEGASAATFPLLMETLLKFQSKASLELFKEDNIVKTRIYGVVNDQTQQQAQRVKEFMNFQLSEGIPDYIDEHERLLFYTGFFGVGYTKNWFDSTVGNIRSVCVPSNMIYVNYWATSMQTAERISEDVFLTENEYKARVNSGLYIDVDIGEPTLAEKSSFQSKVDELIGQDPSSSDDTYHLIEVYRYFDFEGFLAPYIVTLDTASKKIVALRRNWDEQDALKKKKLYHEKWDYVPGFNFYSLGLVHLLGNIQYTLTAVQRSLTDAGQFKNLPAGFKAKGLRMVDGETPLAPGEFREVETAGQPLRDALIPLPFSGADQTLMAMLQYMDGRYSKFVDSSTEVINEASNYGPVGTTLALIEATAKFFSALFRRLHRSLRNELKIIARLNYEYLPDAYPFDVVGGNRQVFKQDFSGNVAVVPVSDPNVPSQAHRVALGQFALQMAQQLPPGTIDTKLLVKNALFDVGIPNVDALFPPPQQPPQPQPLDPMSDIMAAQAGQPIKAFEGQDHDAHIQFKQAFLQNPQAGGNPALQQIAPLIQANIAEHVLLKFKEAVSGLVNQQTQQMQQMQMPGQPGQPPNLDPKVIAQVEAQAAQQIMQAVQQTQQAQQMQTPEYMVAQAALTDSQTKAAKLEQDKAVDFAGLAVRNRELDIRQQENEIRKAETIAKTTERAARVKIDEEKNSLAGNAKLAEIGVKHMANQAKINNAQQE